MGQPGPMNTILSHQEKEMVNGPSDQGNRLRQVFGDMAGSIAGLIPADDIAGKKDKKDPWYTEDKGRPGPPWSTSFIPTEYGFHGMPKGKEEGELSGKVVKGPKETTKRDHGFKPHRSDKGVFFMIRVAYHQARKDGQEKSGGQAPGEPRVELTEFQ